MAEDSRRYDLRYDYDATTIPRVLTAATATELGFTPAAIRNRLQRGAWRQILPRTYLTSDTLTWPDKLYAAAAFAGPDALLSGAAALDDLGLRAIQRPESILVLVPADRQPRSVAWVRVRPSARPVRQALLPGPARAEIARAVADEALTRRRLDDVRALVAEVVRARHCTIEELAVELRHGPQRGSANFRQAIDEIGGGAWSAPEAHAAMLLRRAGAPPFSQNVRIDLPDGTFVVVDFYWPALRAVLEIDSLRHHHDRPGDVDRTDNKHVALETMGLSVIHRTPGYIIRRPDAFTAGVLRWLNTRLRDLA